MNIVPRVATPATLEAIAAALRDAYLDEFGRLLDVRRAELLTAQILIETKNGQSIKNHSPGNISASNKWQGDAWRPPWFDTPTEATSQRDRELHAAMGKGKAPSAFRSFSSLDAGMRDYVRTLSRQFPSILAATTPAELARAIYDSGYTRDHEPEVITPTLAGLVERVRKSGVYDDLAVATPLPKGPAAERAPSGLLPPVPSYRYVSPPVLERGDSGPMVVAWQRILGVLPDGLFGDDTEHSTRQWQSRVSLPVTGRVSVPCWVHATRGPDQARWGLP